MTFPGIAGAGAIVSYSALKTCIDNCGNYKGLFQLKLIILEKQNKKRIDSISGKLSMNEA